MIPKRSSKAIQTILSSRNNIRTIGSTSRSTSTTSTSLIQTHGQGRQQQQQHQQQHRQFYQYNYQNQHLNSINNTSFKNNASTTATNTTHTTTRLFHTESEYHTQADDTLNIIQDTLEFYIEDHDLLPSFEINYASGVLTISLQPKHGTFVLNKQTPNKQIWWSSPLSGPRRYEWDEVMGKWVWTKYVDYCDAKGISGSGSDGNGNGNGNGWTESISLGEALKSEMISLFRIDDGLEELDDL
jgi:frataxin